MNTYADKTQKQEGKSQVTENEVSQQKNDGESTFQFIDNRPEAITQRKLQKIANNSAQATRVSQLQAAADNFVAQKSQPAQQKSSSTPDRIKNKTGMSDQLKSGIETLSGIDTSDVRVHYNSGKPAQMNAHAYAQGTDIHIASGQEKHLPHEAWHTVQQKQGRVQPTIHVNGTAVNDNIGLEREADVMGAKALQMKPIERKRSPITNLVIQNNRYKNQEVGFVNNQLKAIVQRKTLDNTTPVIQKMLIGMTPTDAWNTAHLQSGGYAYQGAGTNVQGLNYFTGAERTTVYTANAPLVPVLTQAQPGWTQVSDEHGDRLYSRADGSLVTPEIDHIVERTDGGSNDLRNARVLSFTQNRAVGTSRPGNAAKMVRTYTAIRIKPAGAGGGGTLYPEGGHLTPLAVNRLLQHRNGVAGAYGGGTAGNITNGDYNTIIGVDPDGMWDNQNGIEIRQG